MNAHQTIYVITPEYTTGSQIILRDNLAPMVKGKHCLLYTSQSTTGFAYDAASGTYGMLRADGTAQLDANTGAQAHFDNPLVL